MNGCHLWVVPLAWGILLCIWFPVVHAENKVVVVPLVADASGDAVPADVLSGKTFSNQNARGLIGTRPPVPVQKISAGSSGPGVEWPEPRFSGGIIFGYRDSLTGLLWALPSTETMNWNDAYDHCDEMVRGFPPHTLENWRLPTVRELHSLIDYGEKAAGQPALPNGHPFSTVTNNPYWTVTLSPLTLTATDAWTVDMQNGAVTPIPKNQPIPVWCVYDN